MTPPLNSRIQRCMCMSSTQSEATRRMSSRLRCALILGITSTPTQRHFGYLIPTMLNFVGLEPLRVTYPASVLFRTKYASEEIAVNEDTLARPMDEFLRQRPASFAVVRDVAQKLVAAANVSSMPSSLLVAPDGTIHYIHAGFRGDETRIKYEKEIEELLKSSKTN